MTHWHRTILLRILAGWFIYSLSEHRAPFGFPAVRYEYRAMCGRVVFHIFRTNAGIVHWMELCSYLCRNDTIQYSIKHLTKMAFVNRCCCTPLYGPNALMALYGSLSIKMQLRLLSLGHNSIIFIKIQCIFRSLVKSLKGIYEHWKYSVLHPNRKMFPILSNFSKFCKFSKKKLFSRNQIFFNKIFQKFAFFSGLFIKSSVFL